MNKEKDDKKFTSKVIIKRAHILLLGFMPIFGPVTSFATASESRISPGEALQAQCPTFSFEIQKCLNSDCSKRDVTGALKKVPIEFSLLQERDHLKRVVCPSGEKLFEKKVNDDYLSKKSFKGAAPIILGDFAWATLVAFAYPSDKGNKPTTDKKIPFIFDIRLIVVEPKEERKKDEKTFVTIKQSELRLPIKKANYHADFEYKSFGKFRAHYWLDGYKATDTESWRPFSDAENSQVQINK